VRVFDLSWEGTCEGRFVLVCFFSFRFFSDGGCGCRRIDIKKCEDGSVEGQGYVRVCGGVVHFIMSVICEVFNFRIDVVWMKVILRRDAH